MTSKNYVRGFTFVEVLVALVIIAVGVAGLVSLQSHFLKSSVRASDRATALSLAQAHIEDMRFQMYEDLASGSNTESVSGKTFALDWSVSPQYFNSGWVTTGDANLPNPLPAEPDAKAVAVTVTWTARGGETETVSTEAWLSRFEMRDGGLATTAPPPRNEPKVTYTPGAAPEVVAIKLTDDSNATVYQVKETTRPTPRIQSKGDKRMVTFDTVTYDQATQTQRVEDFVTVDCLCKFDGVQADVGVTPQRLTLVDGQLALDPDGGTQVTKMVGVPADSNQLELCDKCCRDHHDNFDMVAEGNVYRHESFGARMPSGDHRHFRWSNGFLVQAGLGENYLESCRMRRVDGWYEVYSDWQMHAVTASTSDYLVNETSAANYGDYVRSVVRALIKGEPLPEPLNDRDTTIVPGAYQFIGRAIYLDDMTNEHLATVRQAITNDEPDWITKVPFYEVNVTLLGEWDSSLEAVATVTNEEISTIVNPEEDYYGNYSRGRVQAISGGQSTVNIVVNEGNSGILGVAPIHPNEVNQTIASNLTVTVRAVTEDDQTNLYSISGQFECLYRKVTGQGESWEACKKNDYNGLTISTSDLNISCDFNYVGTGGTPSYSCSGIRQGSNLTVTISSTAGNTVFEPSTITVSDINTNVPQDIKMTVNN
ncbi:prepilin-type N-terminal cleavage/methylation domain-containing protein [Pseudidiomarina donghaiensis]|uniref:Prepilin-type N-terminal cleavage/methylation domain-containing protein n=1 Tax=Pseudidiomarina donghaiensis TaxID=519452 RepID=A0A432XL05_9GAMM|nr:prepilin-type N-terminal cleavage/methylation domain-containing protein [Pseudidiomarina donghaiensis]RUO49377.1 hypothetical protein CWE24_02420 [Pseudidiomarina donghaiensis]SFV21109.1 type IV pilus modification protein PilV [Pseudidiomarina donghaiensis]